MVRLIKDMFGLSSDTISRADHGSILQARGICLFVLYAVPLLPDGLCQELL